jgi:hypothetical protein
MDIKDLINWWNKFSSIDQPAGSTLQKLRVQLFGPSSSITQTGTALDVNISSGGLGVATTGTSQFRSLTVNSTAQAVKATEGNLYGWNILNLNAATIYIKIYDKAAAGVNPAVDVPVRTLMVTANGCVTEFSGIPWNVNSVAISVRAVTGSGDTDTTAPATLPIIEILYS